MGVPVGLRIAGRLGDEATILAAAEAAKKPPGDVPQGVSSKLTLVLGFVGTYVPRSLGSRTSRRASPKRLNP